MRLALERDSVVELYFYLYEAGRSVHKVLGNNWADLRAYYTPLKVRGIQEITGRLEGLLAQQGFHVSPDNNETAWRQEGRLHSLRHLFVKPFARWKARWSFSCEQLQYAVSSLTWFLGVLRLPTKPDADVLIAGRMDLTQCCILLESRCPGLFVFEPHAEIDHLYRSDWLKPIRLTDLLPNKAQPAEAPRKTA